MNPLQKDLNRKTAALARRLAAKAGSPGALAMAISAIITWAMLGPIFGFSDTWQLIINTGTTIVTFILAVSIQYTQNRDSRAIHMKLNKLLEHTADLQETLDSIEEELENDDD